MKYLLLLLFLTSCVSSKISVEMKSTPIMEPNETYGPRPIIHSPKFNRLYMKQISDQGDDCSCAVCIVKF